MTNLFKPRRKEAEMYWGNQVRSYVLQPYQLVKDTRTGVETQDARAVLDGDLDLFLRAALAVPKGKMDPCARFAVELCGK